MKNNNKGYGKFEVLTMIVVLMVIGAFLAYSILGNSEPQKFATMRKDAKNFAKTVVNNLSAAENAKDAYTLGSVVDEGLMNEIDNPFGDDSCNIFESKVELPGSDRYVTLRCGEYLIDHVNVKSGKYDIYKVTDWKEKATDGDSQSKTLYNCQETNGLLFEEYMDEIGLIYSLQNILKQ